jgi:hypothetical protein
VREIQPHRFNNGFSWRPVPRLGGLASEEQADAFDRDGFVLMPGVLDADEVAAARDEIDALEEKKNQWLRSRDPSVQDISAADAITFTELIVGKSEVLKRFATNETFARLAADFVGPNVRIYWDQAVYKRPEPTREFPWHQDTGYTSRSPSTTSRVGRRWSTPPSTTGARGSSRACTCRARSSTGGPTSAGAASTSRRPSRCPSRRRSAT